MNDDMSDILKLAIKSSVQETKEFSSSDLK
jgi:hypothetical protein